VSLLGRTTVGAGSVLRQVARLPPASRLLQGARVGSFAEHGSAGAKAD
jgi:hypothetical protein